LLDHIEVLNYRSLRKVAVKPGRITWLIGANGSGKTNILEVLEFLRAAAGEKVAEFVNQRQGYHEIRWFGEPGAEVSVKVRLRVGSKAEALALRYELKLAASGASYVVAEEFLKPYQTRPGKPAEYIKNLGGQGNLYNAQRRAPDKVPSKGEPGPGPRETFLGHFRAPRYYSLVSRTQEAIRSWSVLSFARVDTRPGSKVRLPRTLGDSARLDQDGGNLTDVLGYLQEKQPTVFDEIQRVTRAAFREVEGIAVRPVVGTNQWVTRARVKGASDDVPIWNLSDGVVRFLCLAVSLLSPESGPVVILDEPEVGMHPAIAPNVVELLRTATGTGARQLFVATHSADIVDQMTSKDVVVVEKEWQSGETRLRPLASDQDLKDWVETYRLGELWREGHLGGRP
jgi:predicted ATPase